MDQLYLGYTQAKGFHESTTRRLLSLDAGDQRALMDIVTTLKASENHTRDLLDWLQEIGLRDGTSVKAVLAQETFGVILTDPRLGRNDKLKRVKEELRRMRFPRLSQIEGEVAKRIHALKLKPQVQLAVPPGVEGGFLTLQLKAGTHQELRELLADLVQVAQRNEVREIFELLDGRRVPEAKGKDEGI